MNPFAIDPELGMLRYCARCDEWWPYDREFWVMVGRRLYCRACHRLHRRTFYERHGR